LKTKSFFYAIMTLAFLTVSLSADNNRTGCDNNISNDKNITNSHRPISRFQEYKPNFLVWYHTQGSDHWRAQYSFRYYITRPHCLCGDTDRYVYYSQKESEKCFKGFQTRTAWFFSYTGEFDFYMTTRDSHPVVNRTNMPAIHVRTYKDNLQYFDTLNKKLPFNIDLKWWELALVHRSNGQIFNTNTENYTPAPVGKDTPQYWTEVQYSKKNERFFDSLSRSENFIQFETKLEIETNTTQEPWKLWLSAKSLYFAEESDVNWDPKIPKDTNFADYDRFRIVLAKKWDVNKRVTLPLINVTASIPFVSPSIEWLVGDRFLKTDSTNIGIEIPVKFNDKYAIPFYIRAHLGPMYKLSNYTKSQDAIGIGFILRQGIN